MLKELAELELVMVLLVMAGIWLCRRGVITEAGRDCLTDLLTELILPCNIFLSFVDNTDIEVLKSSLWTVGISVLVMLVTAGLGWILYRGKEEMQAKVYRYGLINSNAMFVGQPVIHSLLGSAGVLQLSMYMIFVRMFCWSYGLSLYTSVPADRGASLRRLLTHPCMLAAGAGTLVMVMEVPLPVCLNRVLQYGSDCLMALSMLLIGATLSRVRFRDMFRGGVWRFSALRLIVVPALVFAFCRFCGMPELVTATCTLVSGMPAASLTAVLAARFQVDAELGALLVAVSTALSGLTIPLWFFILQ